jgi:hypothetical protein
MTALVVNSLLLMVLGAAVPVYFLGARPDAKSFDWREHVSVKGRYSIQLPDAAQEVQTKVQTDAGPLTLNSVTVNMGQRGEYVSGFYDLSDHTVAASDDEFLDGILRYTMKQGQKVFNKRPLIFASPDGLSVKALEADLQRDMHTTQVLRLYWVRERSTIYVNVATFQTATTNEVSAQKFLESFKLVSR